MNEPIEIRKGQAEDLPHLAAVEAACFPPSEAAAKESLAARLAVYPSHFLLAIDQGKVVGFIDGMVTDEKDLIDSMYDHAGMHDEEGDWQMIFGLNTIPERRREGIAGRLIHAFIDMARKEGRKGLVLTCKDRLIHYYAHFGFTDEGISTSTHGGVLWHQMRLVFEK